MKIDYAKSKHVLLYPNPSNDNLKIVIKASKDEAAQIEIVDANGKVLFSQNINLSSGTSTQTINVSKLAKGNYFVNIKTEEGNKTLKVVKQ